MRKGVVLLASDTRIVIGLRRYCYFEIYILNFVFEVLIFYFLNMIKLRRYFSQVTR